MTLYQIDWQNILELAIILIMRSSCITLVVSHFTTFCVTYWLCSSSCAVFQIKLLLRYIRCATFLRQHPHGDILCFLTVWLLSHECELLSLNLLDTYHDGCNCDPCLAPPILLFDFVSGSYIHYCRIAA